MVKSRARILCLFLCSGGCGKAFLARVSPEQSARTGLAALEQLDGKTLGQMITERETTRTGLSSIAVEKIIAGPFQAATKGLQAIGPATIEPNVGGSALISREYLTRTGSTRGLYLLAMSEADGAKLGPLSMELFTMLGNFEQRPGENHYTAWRRMLHRERPLFESVGWRGMICDSEFKTYRTWNEMEKWLVAEEKRTAAKRP